MKAIITSLLLIFALGAQAQRYDRDRPAPYPGRPERPDRLIMVNVGEERTNKLVSETFSFRPVSWDQRVYRVQVTGTKGQLEIQSARVVYSDGYVRELRELTGPLKEGRRIGAILDGYTIREVQITATSALIGSRGQFRVELGVMR